MSGGTFYEFFAGAGMARAGLGSGWTCLFANDIDHKKVATYSANWGAGEIRQGDVKKVKVSELPGHADLVWGSFPCQDLSLAGAGAGLRGERSGTFWPFWDVMTDLMADGRSPSIIALENVVGTLTSHGGSDFAAILQAVASCGYRFGAMVIDAVNFLPQSRPRLFIIAVHPEVEIPGYMVKERPDASDKAIVNALAKLKPDIADLISSKLVWWNMPAPRVVPKRLSQIIETNPNSVGWHSPAETSKLVSMMSDGNLDKLRKAQRLGTRVYGTIYKRTRPLGDGKTQRAEVRFDDIAGCLRTPAGGSSRQVIMEVEGDRIRSRLISSREAARLMGLPDSYELPAAYNEAYHLVGDGVAVPVVRHLAAHLFEPLLQHSRGAKQAA